MNKTWLQKYKESQIRRSLEETKHLKESSPSAIYFHKVINTFFDVVTWGIIAYFVYIWWKTQGAPIGCDRITPNLCNSCFDYGRNIIAGGLP